MTSFLSSATDIEDSDDFRYLQEDAHACFTNIGEPETESRRYHLQNRERACTAGSEDYKSCSFVNDCWYCLRKGGSLPSCQLNILTRNNLHPTRHAIAVELSAISIPFKARIVGRRSPMVPRKVAGSGLRRVAVGPRRSKKRAVQQSTYLRASHLLQSR
jgi:hypothetical protein